MRASTHRFSAALLLFLLTACGGGGDAGGGEVTGDPVPGGTAILGILTDFQGFNPVTISSITSIEVMQQMLFTPLIRYDEDLKVQPYLAESWDLTDTGVTFRLRQDVKWHDGQPVTAEDVKFTFDLAKDPATASLLGAAFLNLVESAEVVDPHTIRFRFSGPHAQALEGFWWPPLPKHLLGNVSPADLPQAPYNLQPVGSGPFKFASWERNQQLVLEANPDFPQALGGRPYLDRVVFRIIPEPTTMVTELLAGSVDVIGYTLLPDQAQQIASQQGAELKHHTSREFTYVGWNNKRPIFSDPRVRRALAMAINRPQMIEALMHGYAQPAVGMIPPWSPMYTEMQPLPYDPQQAKQLLAQAGWTDSNGDGVLDKGGQPFSFVLMVNSANRMHQDLATVIQQGLKQAGVNVEIRTAEFQTLLRQHRGRDYDAVIANWTLDNFKVDPTPLFSCAEANKEGTANRAGFCDPAVDQLITRGLQTTDEGAAKQIWAEFSQRLQEHQPITFLFWSEDLAGVGPRVQNIQMDVRSKIANIDRWWIPENRRR